MPRLAPKKKLLSILVFTEEINKIVLSSNDEERMQSINSVETYAYGTNQELASEKEDIKWSNIVKLYQND